MTGSTTLAVDLGTSHTVAVVRRADRQPQSLLFDGSPVLPSGVFAGDGGLLHTGRDAERLARAEPHRFEPHPKRLIDDGTVLLGNREIAVPDLLAAVLGRVLTEARNAGLVAGDPVVLTCPADWGRHRREILLEAARRAGVHAPTLVSEPVAAAAYCADVLPGSVPSGRPILVFDFGGGTLDLAVLRIEPAGPRIVAVGGLEDLGGLDVDSTLVGHLGQLIAAHDPALWHRLAQPSGLQELRERAAFWAEVRSAKEMLSRAPSAPVALPGAAQPAHLTREELERLAGPLVDRAVDETRRVLDGACIGPRELGAILLVGGSSRIPLVATRLHSRFGLAPMVPEQPELPVAHGALLTVRTTRPAHPAQPVSAQPAYPVSGDLSAYQPAQQVSAQPGAHTSAPPHWSGAHTSAPPHWSGDETGTGDQRWAPEQPAWAGANLTPGAPPPPAWMNNTAPPMPNPAPPMPARPRRGRSSGLVVVVSVLGVLLLGVLGVGIWQVADALRDRTDNPGANTNTPQAAGPSGTSTAGAAPANDQPLPNGYFWCDKDIFCPSEPQCENAEDDEVECTAPHAQEVFAAGFLPGGGFGDTSKINERPEVKRTCNEDILKKRSKQPNQTKDWAIYTQWQWVNGQNMFLCWSGPEDRSATTGSAFKDK